MNFDERYNYLKGLINAWLGDRFSKRGFAFDGLLEAMEYSLLIGGKRIRPILVMEFSRICGGNEAETLPVACAVEMLHTYSLIHDDLPCMDNDDLRRGRPTNHKVYGECTATLAGDALQAEAFGAILLSELTPERKAKCAEFLAGAAGIDGICGGQFMDMSFEGKTLTEEQLTELQSRKTGSLLAAACAMGAAAAGAGERQTDAALKYGSAIGAAFQMIDDILDVTGNQEEFGKPIGSDSGRGKTTFMSLWGEDACFNTASRITDYAKAVVSESFGADPFLIELADRLLNRRK